MFAQSKRWEGTICPCRQSKEYLQDTPVPSLGLPPSWAAPTHVWSLLSAARAVWKQNRKTNVHRMCSAGSMVLLSLMDPAGWLWAHLVWGQSSFHHEEKKPPIFFRQYFSVLNCSRFPSGPLECMRWELMAVPQSEFCCYCTGSVCPLLGWQALGSHFPPRI